MSTATPPIGDAVGGPLHGVRILEVGGIGPNPFAGMMFADMGADVLRLDRPGAEGAPGRRFDVPTRGRATVGIDLRDPEGQDTVLGLAAEADALIEGFRPGVMERLGLGPDAVRERNPRLVYGRMTGYGQDGPLARTAGHDINYISLTGALGSFAREGERPLAPMNVVGDYGGGAMMLAFGVVCGILEARTSGHGQVVDAAMVDGSALLTAMMHGFRADGSWHDRAGTNLLDSGAHFYETYETADGRHVAVGPLEPQFYVRLLEVLGIDPADAPQDDRSRWPELKARFAAVFRTRTRDEWVALLEGEDACATGVLTMAEAPGHPHLESRGVFVEVDGVLQPQAAPRFSRTPGAARPRPRDLGAALAAWGSAGERLRRPRS
ncbi:CaiB/BaiF CoA transferase family protein [Patulibacter minatonensis]|uniref:CaiB/BaiF CoA transferase family protein n=1 Tax=Patulibacter minatonensis TaxID=298163 RepID=UPI001FE030EC|nr:CaiB/BaiF CoA-transferase family protein [Patulibacter minatonensis]